MLLKKCAFIFFLFSIPHVSYSEEISKYMRLDDLPKGSILILKKEIKVPAYKDSFAYSDLPAYGGGLGREKKDIWEGLDMAFWVEPSNKTRIMRVGRQFIVDKVRFNKQSISKYAHYDIFTIDTKLPKIRVVKGAGSTVYAVDLSLYFFDIKLPVTTDF